MGAAHVQGFAPDALRWGRPCSCQLANHPYLFQSIDAPISLRRICLSSCQIRVLVRVIGFLSDTTAKFSGTRVALQCRKNRQQTPEYPKFQPNGAGMPEVVRVLT